MAKRFIDKDKLIEHLEDDLRECGNPDVATEPITYGCSLGLKGALSYARTLPTADVAEVRHGKWVHTDYAMHWLGKDECSECTYHTSDRDDLSHLKYCPNCSARMDGDEDD